jgi:uncharacterized protein YbjT (DUF2867 family)
VYARDPNKVATLFGKNDHLNVVQGDYSDLEDFKNSIAGHERLFLLLVGFKDMVYLKETMAKLAYTAGVKQVVDISVCQTINPTWRGNAIAETHREAEEAIYKLPNRGNYVALRPSSFFTNHFFSDIRSIQAANNITSSLPANDKRSWISTADVALVSLNVLTEPVEKHGDAVYEMTSQRLSGNERAEILSRVLGKEINYVEVTPKQEYENYKNHVNMPHVMAYSLVDYSPGGYVNRGLNILLDREPETFDVWVASVKDRFL